MNTKTILLATLMCVMTALTARAADELRGRVADSQGKALQGAIVKLMDGDDIAAYCQTNSEGRYTLRLPDDAAEDAMVEVAMFGFDPYSALLKQMREKPDVVLHETARDLQEVIVRPQAIRAKGDTVIYNVDALTQKTDRNIEDVIRRLPGMEVSSSGTISYQGESINRFYVQGLDMLGGRYTLASRNIRPQDVSTISVYERHQPVEALKGIEQSQKAALNITLKRSALMRPIGYAEAGSGNVRHGTAWLGEVFAMFVAPKMQSLFTVKGNNFGRSYAAEAGGAALNYSSVATPFDNLLRAAAAGSASGVSAARQRGNRSLMAQATMLGKVRSTTIKGGVGFTRELTTTTSQTTSVFTMPDGEAPVAMSQGGTTDAQASVISAYAQVEHNTAKLYLNDYAQMRARFGNTYALVSADPKPDASQWLRTHDVEITNRMNAVVRHGSRAFEFTSDLGLRQLPVNRLLATDPASGDLIVSQSARALTFTSREYMSMSWQPSESSRFGGAATLNTDYTRLDASGRSSNTQAPDLNMQHGATYTLRVGPWYQFKRGILTWRTSVPLLLRAMHFTGLSILDGKFDRLQFNPGVSTSIFLKFAQQTVNVDLGYSTSTGGLSNFVSEPIRTSFRSTTRLGSGILTDSKGWTGTAAWSFRDAIRGFFANLKLSGNLGSMNTMAATTVGSGSVAGSVDPRRSHAASWSANLDLAQYIHSIGASLKGGAIASSSRSQMLRNGQQMTATNSSLGFMFGASTTLFNENFSISPQATLDLTRMNSAGAITSPRTLSWGISGSLAFTPGRHIAVEFTPEYADNGLSSGARNRNFFLDARASYKGRRWELSLALNNLTNRRFYAISYNSGLTTLSQFVELRGIETLLSFRYSF